MKKESLFKKIARTHNSLVTEIENLKYLQKRKIPVPRIIIANHKKKILITEKIGTLNPNPNKTEIELLAALIFRLHSIKSSLFGRGFYTPFPISYPVSKVICGQYISHACKYIRMMCDFHLRIAIKKKHCSEKEIRDLNKRLNGFLGQIWNSKDMQRYKSPYSLLHGDLKLRNVVFRTGKPYLVDAEWLHYGDPAYELCNLLFKPPTRPYAFPLHFRSYFINKYLSMGISPKDTTTLLGRINLWAPIQVISKIYLLLRITDEKERKQDGIIQQYTEYLREVEDGKWNIYMQGKKNFK